MTQARDIQPTVFRSSLLWRLGIAVFLGFLIAGWGVWLFHPQLGLLLALAILTPLVGWYTALIWTVRLRFDGRGVHYRSLRAKERWSVPWEEADRAERQLEIDAENEDERLYLKRKDGTEVELTGRMPFTTRALDRMVALLEEARVETTTLDPC